MDERKGERGGLIEDVSLINGAYFARSRRNPKIINFDTGVRWPRRIPTLPSPIYIYIYIYPMIFISRYRERVREWEREGSMHYSCTISFRHLSTITRGIAWFCRKKISTRSRWRTVMHESLPRTVFPTLALARTCRTEREKCIYLIRFE